MSDLLAATGLCLVRGDRCLFQDLDLALRAGELLLVEGPNGSGKTSLLRGLAGLLSFESGEVRWRDQTGNSTVPALRGEMVWLAHKTGFKADLSLAENLQFESALRQTIGADLNSVLQRLDLTRLKELPFGSLSAGQQRRVSLARMLLARACLWIMDEPFTNLDAAGQSLVIELIGGHLDAGGSAIVASHQDLGLKLPLRRLSLQ